MGPVEEEGMQHRCLPFPTFYKGQNDMRVNEIMVSGYPAYVLNEETNKTEVNYFAYGAIGSLKAMG